MPSANAKGNRTRKTLSFFRVNFGHVAPYEVLCDGPTIFQSLKNDLYLKQSLPKLFDGPAYPVVTKCVVDELRSLGEDYSSAALFAKRVKRVSCVHKGDASVTECLASLLQSPSETKLVLATTDPDFIARVNRIPGIPIVSILNQKKFVLDSPSAATLRYVKKAEKVKTHSLSEPDKALVDHVNAAEELLLEKRLVRRKRKRAKGPNPLSVKKRKTINEQNSENQQHRSSKPAGSTALTDGTSPDPDMRNGKTKEISNRTSGQAMQLKAHQRDADAPDAGNDDASQDRIRGKGKGKLSDVGKMNDIKGMGETEKRSKSGSESGPHLTPKPSSKRRRKNARGEGDSTAANGKAVDSSSMSPASVGLLNEASVTFQDSSRNGVSGSNGQNSQGRTAPERREGSSNDNAASMDTDGRADAGRTQPLDYYGPTPNVAEPEPSERIGTEGLQMKESMSAALEKRHVDELQGTTRARENILSGVDNAQSTTMDETGVIPEGDSGIRSAGMDGKKKKQRKNRRRRPKKMATH